MVKVIGILTLETVPGLNRHCRNALVAALSRMGLPVLCATEQLVTLPLPGSTSTTMTPLPVMCRERASYGYCGFGPYKGEGFRSRHRHRAGALDGHKFLRGLLSRWRCSFFHKLRLNVRWRRRFRNRNIFRRRSRLRRSQDRLYDCWWLRRKLYGRSFVPLRNRNRREVDCQSSTQRGPEIPSRRWPID